MIFFLISFHALHMQIVSMRSFVECTFSSWLIPLQNPLSSELSVVSFSSIEGSGISEIEMDEENVGTTTSGYVAWSEILTCKAI